MKPAGIFFATGEGQTGRIAEHVATDLRARGFEADVRNLANEPEIHLTDYSVVVLAASVHVGRHEPEMIRFVKQHATELNSLPTTFLSVTLSEAGAERVSSTPEERARFASDAQWVIDMFLKSTGWRPKRFKAVAGALMYTKYNFLVRFLMKRIAKKVGAETDTSRDYEYTDWKAIDSLANELCEEISTLQTASNSS